jgi:hypothetical protein
MKVRLDRVHKFNTDITLHDVCQFNNENFELFLSGVEKQYNERVEAERIIEKKRQAELKAEQERIEAQRLENERLKKEAEIKEAELKAEREKAEKERLRVEAENKAKLDAERLEREKVEAELKAKQEAELKAERERKEAEYKARKEAEKLAKAPIKTKMSVWVNSFDLPLIDVENEKTTEIIAKFEAFKSWSLTQIESL